MGEKEIDSGTWTQLGRLFLALPTGSDGVDHLRLVVSVLQGPHGPVREREPVFAARSDSQHAVKGLSARIRVRIQALAFLKGP
jgi:hypothetical protein